MPKLRNPHRKDPNKSFRCKICKEWQSGKQFYITHTTLNCVTCLSKKRKEQGGYLRCDITKTSTTKGNFMRMFKYVVKRLTNRKGLHWRTTLKWFSTQNVQAFDDYIRDQIKEQKLNIGDYKKTWKLGFIQTDGLTLSDQFKYRNLLVVSIKQ